MLAYIARRLLMMIPTLFAISLVAFIIIQLPPGDYLTTYVATLAAEGEDIDEAVLASLEARYGLNQPIYVQYYKWITNIILRGDFGYSWDWGRAVSDLIGQRLALTFLISLTTLLFIWAVAFPVGIYSAVKQYSIGDYFFTFVSFLGRSIPSFMLALILMWIAFSAFRHERRRPLLQRVRGSPMEWRESRRSAQTPVASAGRLGNRRHGGPDSHYAGQFAGRTAQALRAHGALQRVEGEQTAHQVPGPGGAEPLRQHPGLDACRASSPAAASSPSCSTFPPRGHCS